MATCTCHKILGISCVLLSVIVLAFVINFFCFLDERPSIVNFEVTQATLTDFNYTATNTTLRYNLALNITLQNPNKYYDIDYDSIEVMAYYHNHMLDRMNLNPFYQNNNTIVALTPSFIGQQLVVLGVDELYKFQSGATVYNIVVKLHLRNKYFTSQRDQSSTRWRVLVKLNIVCNLKVPLITTYINGGQSASSSFETTKCDRHAKLLSLSLRN